MEQGTVRHSGSWGGLWREGSAEHAPPPSPCLPTSAQALQFLDARPGTLASFPGASASLSVKRGPSDLASRAWKDRTRFCFKGVGGHHGGKAERANVRGASNETYTASREEEGCQGS